MRICVLTHTFPRNESDTAAAFMKEFSDGLVQAGADVTVVAPFDPQFKRKDDPFKIVTYKYVWPNNLHVLGYSRTMERDVALRKRAYLLLPFLVLFGSLALFKTVKKEKIGLINVHWILPNGLMALIVSRVTGIPYVITLPGTDAYLAFRYKLFGWAAGLIARNSAGIISNSSRHLNRILKLGVEGKRTAICSYPVDVSVYKPLSKGIDNFRKKHGIDPDDFVLLAVGRLVYKKGFYYLIKAMPGLLRRFPRTKLVIGGDGELRAELKKLTVKLGIADRVLFAGNIDRNDIVYYYNMADVMVSPSIVDKEGNVDGGPVASFESMACGKPQVVTDILGVAEIIKNGVNGYKVPQKDYKAIEEALVKLLESKSLRAKMGKANRRLVVDKLSTEKVGKYYLEFFKSVLF